MEDATNETRSGFILVEESPDDLVIYQNGKPVLSIDVVDKEIVWCKK